MSLSPSDILHRLKQLKLWQESQEELLRTTKNHLETTTVSDYQTIQGLSDFDSTHETTTNKPENWDSQLISPTKTFNELLEEKLAQDPGPASVIQKEKKPFLKKGAGLERFRMKARPPPKPKVKRKKLFNKASPSGVTPLIAPDLSIRPKATWSKIDESEEHVRKINAQIKSPHTDQTLYEKQLEKELMIFEALEQRVENTSFCSTNSSVARIFETTPTKKVPTIPEEKRVHWESNSEDEEVIETNLEREDIAEILLRLKSLAENKPNIPSVIDASDSEKWSSSDISSVVSTDLEETLRVETRDIGVGTTPPESCPICNDTLKRTITEYEDKIKEVIEDKNRISDLKQQLEQKERDFLQKKRDFQDEKQDLLFELETERKKLLKEKHLFQTLRDSQSRPTKKERQEISNLKQEVADLTETLKLKESKNGMTQARLRNQIKQLEKDKENLKNEVEKLTKENAKLTASQKLNRKSTDSKILLEINKNISKLTKKTDDDNSKRKISIDTEDSFLEMNQNNIEAQYENTFRSQSARDTRTAGNCFSSRELQPPIATERDDDVRENNRLNGKIERTRDDGTKEIKYTNGNVKTISPDGNFIKIHYFNGDNQETNLLDGTVIYYFSGKNIRQTTYADGLEVVEFPEGVVEKRYTDGRSEVTLPDGVVQTTLPDGTHETHYLDGSTVTIHPSGEKILVLTNGQKEIETKEYKRREYPDGTVKILYPDGTLETKYANGRVRIKDGKGTLILDTQT